MRAMLLTISLVVGLSPNAAADSQDDLAFARSLTPRECFRRAFTPDEISRLQSIINIDEHETDRSKTQAAYFSKDALRCQANYQRKVHQEQEERNRRGERDAALAASPECQAAFQASAGLDVFTLLPEAADIKSLADAGDTVTACQQSESLQDKLERARAGLMTCYKSIRGAGDGPELLKEEALRRATDANQVKLGLASNADAYHCSP